VIVDVLLLVVIVVVIVAVVMGTTVAIELVGIAGYSPIQDNYAARWLRYLMGSFCLFLG
jgi:hypothetical protein